MSDGSQVAPMETPDYPELLEDLRTFLLVELRRMGLEKHSERIALAVIEHIFNYWSGEQLYIPRGRVLKKKARDEAMLREFNGNNTRELCRKHRITQSYFYRVTKALRKKLAEQET